MTLPSFPFPQSHQPPPEAGTDNSLREGRGRTVSRAGAAPRVEMQSRRVAQLPRLVAVDLRIRAGGGVLSSFSAEGGAAGGSRRLCIFIRGAGLASGLFVFVHSHHLISLLTCNGLWSVTSARKEGARGLSRRLRTSRRRIGLASEVLHAPFPLVALRERSGSWLVTSAPRVERRTVSWRSCIFQRGARPTSTARLSSLPSLADCFW